MGEFVWPDLHLGKVCHETRLRADMILPSAPSSSHFHNKRTVKRWRQGQEWVTTVKMVDIADVPATRPGCGFRPTHLGGTNGAYPAGR